MGNTTGSKYAGRIKGTKNKNLIEVRNAFQLLVENNIERLQEDLDSLNPFERIKVIIDLSKFCLPTLKAVDVMPVNIITERPNIQFIESTIKEIESKY